MLALKKKSTPTSKHETRRRENAPGRVPSERGTRRRERSGWHIPKKVLLGAIRSERALLLCCCCGCWCCRVGCCVLLRVLCALLHNLIICFGSTTTTTVLLYVYSVPIYKYRFLLTINAENVLIFQYRVVRIYLWLANQNCSECGENAANQN